MNLSHLAGAIAVGASFAGLPVALLGYASVFSGRAHEFMAGRKWIPCLAIAVVVASYAVNVAAQFGPDNSLPLHNEYDKLFSNGVVVLDGHAFYNCIFNNVVFRWDGGPSFMMNPRFIGASGLQSRDQKVVLTVDLLRRLGCLDSGFAARWSHPPAAPHPPR